MELMDASGSRGMEIMRQYFTYNGKSSKDFEVWISGSGVYNSPGRDIDTIAVPGRNGDLTIDNGRFFNIDIVYPAFIFESFLSNFSAFKAYMASIRGYKRLEDTYHPDHYRLARFKSELQPEMNVHNKIGSFDLVFDCDPRRFLKTGEVPFMLTSAGTIKNPTQFDSLPLIRAYGTGTLTIGDCSVVISTANVYTDIDCEAQEAYKGSTNCNNNIILGNGEFPKLSPGNNSISFTGLTQVDITPRWWTV